MAEIETKPRARDVLCGPVTAPLCLSLVLVASCFDLARGVPTVRETLTLATTACACGFATAAALGAMSELTRRSPGRSDRAGRWAAAAARATLACSATATLALWVATRG